MATSIKFQNIVIGKPIVGPSEIFAKDLNDWENLEKDMTWFTNTRFLPAILKELGIVNSTSEVRKNKPELFKELIGPDFIEVKWGKNKFNILIGP